jgi:AAA domain
LDRPGAIPLMVRCTRCVAWFLPSGRSRAGTEGLDLAHEFSMGMLDRSDQSVSNYDPDAVEEKWKSFTDKPGGAHFGKLVNMAKTAGCVPSWGEPERDKSRTFKDAFPDAEGEHFWNGDGFDWSMSAEAKADKASGPFLERIGDLLARPDPQPLVKDFLMQGENVCIVGPPKGGKTHGTLDTSLSIACGLPVFGFLEVLRPGPVIYLSGEGHAGMKKRVKAWCQDRGLKIGIGRFGLETVFAPDGNEVPFFYRAAVPMTRNGSAEAAKYIKGIRDFLKADGLGEPVLIVIDTMARAMSGTNENDSGDAGLYLEITEAIRAGLGSRCTTVTVAHCPKDQR